MKTKAQIKAKLDEARDEMNRVLDHRPLGRAAAGAASEEVPDARAEVGAAEQRVRDEADEHHAQHDLGERHRTGSSS